MYRTVGGKLEVFLVHPGGPYFKNKNKGFWMIPKGGVEDGEELFEAAKREFNEETGLDPMGNFIALGSIKQKSGKIVHVWAFEGDLPKNFVFKSIPWDVEWPPKSGRIQKFPELDKGQFFGMSEAKEFIIPAQVEMLERLEKLLKLG